MAGAVVRGAIEALLLALLCLAPRAYPPRPRNCIGGLMKGAIMGLLETARRFRDTRDGGPCGLPVAPSPARPRLHDQQLDLYQQRRLPERYQRRSQDPDL